ncbi:alpha/beta hydrolase [Agromyces protaetiae]|uniref:Alpha/beta hydrolase n=1 Tax=Agromyces protaetiae TaxID=2509455 RepID=A0A4P6FGS5_9MICO|nr:alpha/beta hydrolase [Agromyces protaetiae]QAY73067.1 alpha/beta hydrolase [Agromyces protaetiae]
MTDPQKPTAVLVHGAFAESSSWDDVIVGLQAEGYRVIAVANPLRSVASDSAYLKRVVDSIPGPVVLVGHSWGGMLISQAAVGSPNVTGLVYVAAFAPEAGESAADLSEGGSLGPTLTAIALEDGSNDVYVDPAKYHHQFCADVPDAQAAILAATQRPIRDAGLGEPASQDEPAWKHLPSWFLFGDQDLNIPVSSHRSMAARAGAVRTEEVPGASHVVGVSHPDKAIAIVLEALRAG